jgi:hypothetical protein
VFGGRGAVENRGRECWSGQLSCVGDVLVFFVVCSSRSGVSSQWAGSRQH